MDTLRKLSDWLSDNSQLVSLKMGHVTIGTVGWPAAHAVRVLRTIKGSRAYEEGEREYHQESIYCIGMLPLVALRGKVAFRLGGDYRDWFVSCYHGDVTRRTQEAKPPSDLHPFGNTFMLAPWDVQGSSLDDGERKPRVRVPMAFDDAEAISDQDTGRN